MDLVEADGAYALQEITLEREPSPDRSRTGARGGRQGEAVVAELEWDAGGGRDQMTDLVPDASRIDRAALERIIKRAAELQTVERDIGDGLTERELLELGQEVGIPGRYLQQALVEEQTRAVTHAEPGIAAWLSGPRYISAQRAVPGQVDTVRAALHHWMIEGELLAVRRRFPDRTSWEPRRDMVASLKRGFDMGGRSYRLAHAREIVGRVSRLDDTACHVYLLADLSNTRRTHLGGAATIAGSGAVATTVGITLGILLPIALLPAGVGLIAGVALARRRLGQLEQMQVGLERVLDRLEHGEVRPGGSDPGGRGAFERIAREIRKGLGA